MDEMNIEMIHQWHERARPNPTDAHTSVQIGCHIEEVAEMLQALQFKIADDGSVLKTQIRASLIHSIDGLNRLAEEIKAGSVFVKIPTGNREDVLDALCDQIVTAVGVAQCARMDVVRGLDRVNESNWSKFDDNGHPVFDQNGKVTKGIGYKAPDLKDLI